MSDPLITEIARYSLQLITDAWDLPPTHIYHRPGPWEMAHHILRVELSLTGREIALLLTCSVKAYYNNVQRGQHYYKVWPAYQQRYDSVRMSMLSRFQLRVVGRDQQSASSCG